MRLLEAFIYKTIHHRYLESVWEFLLRGSLVTYTLFIFPARSRLQEIRTASEVVVRDRTSDTETPETGQRVLVGGRHAQKRNDVIVDRAVPIPRRSARPTLSVTT